MYVHNFGRDARAAQDALAPALPADPAGNDPGQFSTVGLIGYLPGSDERRVAIWWERQAACKSERFAGPSRGRV